MDFEQAKELARTGVKITHQYFADNEYFTMRGNRIVFEDGCSIFADDWAKDKAWTAKGWEKFKE